MALLNYHAGTLELSDVEPNLAESLSEMRWDERSQCWRAPAIAYANVVLGLRDLGVELRDQARRYEELTVKLQVRREPRPYQSEALAAWVKARGRGVVVLPTGSGKSQVAVMAIAEKRRSTLVVVPTLDLVRQWYDLLRTSFQTEVGLVGGGDHIVLPLTVTTYDSAFIHMDHLGSKFGLVVFDECHHLPGASYQLAARQSLAPFRLGLTATPERTDGRNLDLAELIGPIVYRKDVSSMSGEHLAQYETIRVFVDMSPEDKAEYEAERERYLTFLRRQGIRMSSPTGWQDFIQRSARTEDGRRAMLAYRRQRDLAFTSATKLAVVEDLLARHARDKVLLFTVDNATAYTLARRFLVPIITHQTRVKERSDILARFSSGEYGTVATSKVLNEGVDVPDANVAIVLSGSGSVREHVQRLGRILRPRDGKRAVFYELISGDTAERGTSERRRDHEAYREDERC